VSTGAFLIYQAELARFKTNWLKKKLSDHEAYDPALEGFYTRYSKSKRVY